MIVERYEEISTLDWFFIGTKSEKNWTFPSLFRFIVKLKYRKQSIVVKIAPSQMVLFVLAYFTPNQ